MKANSFRYSACFPIHAKLFCNDLTILFVMYKIPILNFLLLLFCVCKSQNEENENCVLEKTGVNGTCLRFENCPQARSLLEGGQTPQHCGFNGSTPIVCCPIAERISKKQCKNYSYPSWSTYLKKVPSYAFVGGNFSKVAQFPHMALLGYGSENNIQWLCGGSLISEDFVLTAAHCVFSPQLGFVNWVRLGEVDLNSTTEGTEVQNFYIIQRFQHPDYRPPSQYNDIALLQMDHFAKFNSFVKPACLYLKRNIDPTQKLTAMGWGLTSYNGDRSNILIYGDIDSVDHETCAKHYARVSKIKLAQGILDDLHICAGDNTKDTCQGDSGGPLQVRVFTHFEIVGITSFGKACGISHSPGVYTRIYHYLDWIEGIVWSN